MTISEIKKTAKTELSGSYLRSCSATLIYFIAILILNFFERNIINAISNDIVTSLISAIFAIISLLLSYGILANTLDIVAIKTNSITDFINIAIKNTTRYLKIMVTILLKVLIPLIIFLTSVFYCIGTMSAKIYNQQFLCFYPNLLYLSIGIAIVTLIIFLYFLIKYALSPYIYYENSEESAKDIVEKSHTLMKGNMGKFILLILSFFGWIIGASVILFLLNQFVPSQYLTPFIILFYSFLKPYIIVSQSIFYDDCKDEKSESKKSKINNK